MTVKVLFVCLGNICRSVTAHGVFQQLVRTQGLDHTILVDSAGTSDWHTGKAPDKRSIAAAKNRGYDLSQFRARQAKAADFEHFDYVLAMDSENLSHLQSMAPDDFPGVLGLFLEYGNNLPLREVPDPYYGDGAGFETVLDLVEVASEGLLKHIISRHRL